MAMTSSRRLLHCLSLTAISWMACRNVFSFDASGMAFEGGVGGEPSSSSDVIIRNVTRYPQPSTMSIPDGCVEPKDKATGWPIVPIATCLDTYLFKFEEQLIRPRRQMTMEMSDPTKAVSTGCNGGATSPCNQPVVMRCRVWDFRRPAHFIVNFLPCWSAWFEYTHRNDTNAELMLVPGNNHRLGEGDVSTFARDWIEVFNCTVEINGVLHPQRDQRQQNDTVACTTQQQPQYIDVLFESVGTRGFPPGNGFHFDLMRDWPKEKGMFSYFLQSDHAYAFRSYAHSRLSGHEAYARQNRIAEGSAASPTFRVLIINRNNGKRVIGGTAIAHITDNIRDKLSELGVPDSAIRVNYTDDFGAWDGYGQLRMMRDTDIVISPHGNQLSSIGLAPECAAVMEVYPRYFAVPGFFLPWAVNAGIQSFGLYHGSDIFLVEHYLKPKGRLGRAAVRDAPFINVTDEIVMALPALVEARRGCCQILLDNGEFDRAVGSRCMG